MSRRGVLAIIAPLVAVAALVGCSTRGALYHPQVSPGWNAARGKTLIAYYGCGACHVIGGVQGANGHVGPPLTHFVRTYHQIAGVMPNTPQNLVRWIMNPPKFVPKVDMPVLGIGLHGARDIAAYLYGQ